MTRRIWIKIASWTFVDLVGTRILDAGITFLVIRSLPTESFSGVALAQALITPWLILFVPPAAIIYRDYRIWRAEGAATLSWKLGVLRTYGFLAWAIASTLGSAIFLLIWKQAEWSHLLWAWTLTLGLYISGADREFLRIELAPRRVVFITLIQKLLVLSGFAISYIWAPDHLMPVLAASIIVSYLVYSRALRRWALAACASPAVKRSFKESLHSLTGHMRDFLIWNHAGGVLFGWIQTMDLFMAGVFKLPAHETGLYAVAAKLANFVSILPNALTNTFSVWLSRADKSGKETLIRVTLTILGTATLTAIALIWLAPYALDWLGRGRWSIEEKHQIIAWMKSLSIGGVMLSSGTGFMLWHSIKGNVKRTLFTIYLPGSIIAASTYVTALHFGGLSAAAKASAGVGTVFLLLAYFSRRGAQ
jgi:hypothetical protein